MKYYKLDVNGRIVAKYARYQSGQPELELLPEPVGIEFPKWNGTVWEYDIEMYAEDCIQRARNLYYTRFPDSSKTIAAIQAQYANLKTNSVTWTTILEVNTAYNDFETFMDLS